MKRLRKRHGKGIQFFACGEYGEKFGRPHYHLVLFGVDWSRTRRLHHTDNRTGFHYYTDEDLSDPHTGLWPYGHSMISDVTFDSAAYVARYVTKKITGDRATGHYETLEPTTGEFYMRTPEFATMSKHNPIGSRWVKDHPEEVLSDKFVGPNHKVMRAPRFYEKLIEVAYPDDFKNLTRKRKLAATQQKDNNDNRLRVREAVTKAKIEFFARDGKGLL